MYKSSSLFFVSLLVSLTNFWIWIVVNKDLLFGLSLVLVSVLLSYLIVIKLNKKIFLITLLVFFLISYQVIKDGFDKRFERLPPYQQKLMDERHGYFSIDLGILFQNKLTLRLYKDILPYLNIYEGNVFNSLSPNLYFFSNHPREREKVWEFTMYPSIFLLPFLVGLIQLFNFSKRLILIYFLLAPGFTGFISQSYVFGPILFFPLINLLITMGILRIFRFIKIS